MHGDEQGMRVTASVFGRTMWVIAGAVPFWYMAHGAEVAWMENLTDDGTGTVYATAGLWAIFLVLFLGAMLWRFPRARTAAVAGWALSLLPAAGLAVWAYSLAVPY
ncbi:hypothetical protein Q0Z83_066130 [Actinoplanes sichuanensis]|uniref:Uncharacterized protein n=1 Tax=Actinoplanes sichuanensis TaxID=512349 RepID=A0ABW4APR7_9ACTN|nr:hypothetical protein [Actinoplanes sichuanensis]BEL08422.1 hypothetical protein Q0Z83_066130 [Actinoplanes sichuanensis]